MGVRCSKNPVSLQSKHGLAYNLDRNGVGCLCKMFARERKREWRKSRKQEWSVERRWGKFLKFLQFENKHAWAVCVYVVLERGEKCWVNNESVWAVLAETCLLWSLEVMRAFWNCVEVMGVGTRACLFPCQCVFLKMCVFVKLQEEELITSYSSAMGAARVREKEKRIVTEQGAGLPSSFWTR